jgi:hypothetical protein
MQEINVKIFFNWLDCKKQKANELSTMVGTIYHITLNFIALRRKEKTKRDIL